jgi:Ca-activated chloride channel family protein
MENNIENIDDKFREASNVSDEKMNKLEMDNIWNKVEEKLDKKEGKKRILPVLYPYGIAASLIIASGIYFFNSKNSTEIEQTQIVKDEGKPIRNPEVQKIDETIKNNIEKEITSKEPKIAAIHIPNRTKIVNTLPKKNAVYTEFGTYNMRVGKYTTDEYYIKKQSPPSISNSKNSSLENVVITGLGIKRESNSSAINVQTISADQLFSRPNSNVLNALSGKVAGLEVFDMDGISENEVQIKIRGISSLKEGNEPLVVINGELYNANVLQVLKPKKVKKITVLKGEAAASIYGVKGQNGVIVIETKHLRRKIREDLRKVSDEFVPTKPKDIISQPENSEEYDAFIENPFESTKNEPLSTFSIDVDKAAYSNIRRMINNGQKVDKNAVRIEEMINYFNYSYPQPTDNKPFSVNSEYSDAVWNSQHKLLKIGLKGKEIFMEKLPNSNIVFLIDVSGSMSDENKLPLLKSSFKVLLDKMKPEDKVGIVVYAGSAGMVLEPTLVKNKEKIIASLDNLQAGGSTAGGAGIELAYKLAQENFIKNGNNRVIIATDGDFNVGSSSTADLGTLIEEKRKSGVFLTCLGFGMGNYKDNTLETLADKGNGNYAYIDNMQEANKFLGREFAGSMYAIAKDVKIQIEFNPKYVKSYRLIGYENRKLQNEDFADDKKDAGELGSGHTVTALYEIIPVGVNSEFEVKDLNLKYSKSRENSQNFGDELATIKLRYKKPNEDKSIEFQQIIKNKSENFAQTSTDYKFASAVSWFGLVLRDSKFIKDKNVNEIEHLAKQGLANDEDGFRSEFIRLVEAYKTIK